MIQSMSRSLSDSRRLSPLRRSGQHGSSRRDRETQAANKAAAGAQRRKRQKARRLNRERRSRGEESRSLGQLMTPGPGIPPRITLEDLGPEGLQMSGKWPYSTHSAAVWKVVYSCLVFLFSCCLVFLFSCFLVFLFSCSLVLLFLCSFDLLCRWHGWQQRLGTNCVSTTTTRRSLSWQFHAQQRRFHAAGR